MTELPATSLGLRPRILVRAPESLLDAVFTMAGLQALRKALPDAKLTVLAPETQSALWRGHPDVEHLWLRTAKDTSSSIIRSWRAEAFDVALVASASGRAAWEAWRAGTAMRIGFARGWWRWLLTHRVAPRPVALERPMSVRQVRRAVSEPTGTSAAVAVREHAGAAWLRLVAALGVPLQAERPQIALTKAEIRRACERLGLPDPEADLLPWVTLDLRAAAAPASRLPEDRWREAVARVHTATPCRWLLAGGIRDRDFSRPLAVRLARQLAPWRQTVETPGAVATEQWVFHLAGKATLREWLAVAARSHVVVATHPASLHLAAAAGASTLGLAGGLDPEAWRPGSKTDLRHRMLLSPTPCVACRRRVCPLDRRCIEGVTAEEIAAALGALLKSARS